MEKSEEKLVMGVTFDEGQVSLYGDYPTWQKIRERSRRGYMNEMTGHSVGNECMLGESHRVPLSDARIRWLFSLF